MIATMSGETLELTEARYHKALKRLGFRLALIVSISGMAQIVSHWIGG